MVDKFEGKFPRLSKSNSIAVDGHIFYVKKVSVIYVAYDYESKFKVAVNANGKEDMFSWLHDNIEEIKRRINEERKNG